MVPQVVPAKPAAGGAAGGKPAAAGMVAAGAIVPAGGAAGAAALRPKKVETQNLPVLEAKLSTDANSLYEGVLDLNVSGQHLEATWRTLVELRGKIREAYGAPPEAISTPAGGAGKGAGKQAGGSQWGADWGAAGGSGAGTIDWKSKLTQAVTKQSRRALTKGELAFRMVSEEANKYVAAVSFSGWQAAEYTGVEATSKRQAEHEAAKVALQAEYPEEYTAAEAGQAFQGFSAWFAAKGPEAMQTGQKRKAAALDGLPPTIDPKSRLNQAIQLMLTRPIAKGDIQYDTRESEGSFISTVTLTNVPGPIEGTAAENQKLAEQSAATAALEQLAPQLGPLEEEAKAKKAQKLREQRQARLEKVEQQKKAKAAA